MKLLKRILTKKQQMVKPKKMQQSSKINKNHHILRVKLVIYMESRPLRTYSVTWDVHQHIFIYGIRIIFIYK
jgi:hypothetical protein